MERFSFIIMAVAVVLMLGGTVIMIVRRGHAVGLWTGSAISGAGYGLASAALSRGVDVHLIYYLLVYAIGHAGALAAIRAVGRQRMPVSRLAGLYYRNPALCAMTGVFLLSLAGLPPAGGFAAKLLLLFQAASQGELLATAVMTVCMAVSFYGYFIFVRWMFMRTGPDDSPIPLPASAAGMLAVMAAALMAMGLFPGQILHFLGNIL
ncbi:proton-conducting transporter membrane subunit [Paenibacillus thailandensis]|jgi:NADH-quinone oxidoreductase subunit N|uniref:Proton-conducting transporter membrane subunit n=1 Tax=Paenibacillus thailandensis TaxID=393250 RepID=A0ABW5R3U6_9BACL